mmetsp:Transcript_47684/g.102111  ORF Transcript_47684/g.102111 Transcript_47684/m.102111 type:complete len:414 (+) Transcript_47684:96-1337(+)
MTTPRPEVDAILMEEDGDESETPSVVPMHKVTMSVTRRAFFLFIALAGPGGLLYALKLGRSSTAVSGPLIKPSNEAEILGLVGITEPDDDDVADAWKSLLTDALRKNKSLGSSFGLPGQHKSHLDLAFGLKGKGRAANRSLDEFAGTEELDFESNEYGARIASCVINVMQSGFKLAQGGVAIDIAAGYGGTCSRTLDTPAEQAACANTIAAVFALWGYAAQFLASAAGACSGSLTREIGCAADISGLTASVAQLAAAGAGIAATCANPQVAKKTVKTIQGIKTIQRSEATCALHSMEAIDFLVRAGLTLNGAIIDCSHIGEGDAIEEDLCACSVSGVIESFSFAASSISGAAASCPAITTTAPACAADIINVVAGLAGVSSAITSILHGDSCMKGSPLKSGSAHGHFGLRNGR